MYKSIHPSCFATSLLLWIALLFPIQLIGAEQTDIHAGSSVPSVAQIIPAAVSSIPQTQTADQFDSMESPRNYLSGKIANFANYIDRFFGGNRHYQESNQSVVQFDLTRVTGYGGDGKPKLAARVNLKLPATEGRLRLLLETDPENNISAEPVPGSTVLRDKVVVPRSAALAARYATAEENQWHFSTDGGIKFPIPVKPFVRARGSYSTPVGEWRLNAAESVYWFNTLGAGETTQFDLERIISAPLLFRSSSIATWLNDKQNFDLRQDLTFFHRLNDRSALRYQASAIGVSNPQLQVTDYVLLVFYRYRLHKEWLFYEISPQLHFPREKQYQSSPALSMRLEMLFDESR